MSLARYRRCALACVLISPVLLSRASAQQYQEQAALLPGVRWTEGVEAADVDRDGDFDLFFADGEGFSQPGAQRQNVLLVNQLVGTGSLSFTDESVARLGTNLSNAKGVFTGDVDDDGWIDAMFANAFNTDPPFLYVNRGAAQPGFFDEEGGVRGFTQAYSSASGQFGDIDDDGDLDVVLCDSGSSFLAGAGDRPHLFVNDGTGQFSEVTGPAWSPPVKRAHMDVHLVDIDGDWDLDFFGPNRASNSGGEHYLMLNDGTGSFTDVSSTLPTSSGTVYEADVGDLDGDTDLDLFFVSLNGFDEGAMRNAQVPSGSLSFTKLPSLSATFDDNEIVLVDHDSDGDLDAFVASLGAREGMWTNDGTAGFTNALALVQAIADSSLDATAVDLDLDGDYDLVTAQGESSPAQWRNKVYLNQSGAADDLPPRFLGVTPALAVDPMSQTFAAHAKMQDQVSDDGKNWVVGRAHWVFGPDLPATVVQVEDTRFAPASVVVQSGASVIFAGAGTGQVSVARASGPYLPQTVSLAPGQLYEAVFVRPGTYLFDGAGGAFQGQVVVQGASSTAEALHQGGGQYRFAMTGGPAARLSYELEFEDVAGNVRALAPTRTLGGTPPPTATSFCFGDGGASPGCTPCPCANDAPSGSTGGCRNGAGTSGELLASGTPSVSVDSLRLEATGVNVQTFGILLSGAVPLPSNAGNPCFGALSGIQSAQLDGLRCVGGGVFRHGTRPSDVNGTIGATTNGWGGVDGPPAGLIAQGGFVAGQSRFFQLFYRENPALGCGRGQNTTQAIELMILP